MTGQIIGRLAMILAVASISTSSLGQTNVGYDSWSKATTVVAIAPDGTWGVATDPFVNHAIADAISACKRKYSREIGCGYQMTFVHGGWSLAIRCGKENILVAARTLEAAEQAAVNREYELRQKYVPDMPGCVRVLTVDPNGIVAAPDVRQLLRLVAERAP